jgi:type IX secretion system protein PorV
MMIKTLVLILLPVFVFAGFPKAGTVAAPFLKIGAGARAIALGGNYVGIANDVTALYWNPAGITKLDRISFSATHTQWFADIKHNAVMFSVPIDNSSAFGIEVLHLTSGDIEQTTIDEQEGNGIFYDATDFSMGVAYARALTDRFSVAVKGKYITQTLYNEESSTFAIDFGTIYKTEFKGLTIGMNLANFGGNMQMVGNDLSRAEVDPNTGQEFETQFKTESWPLPIIFRVGIAMDIVGNEETFFPNEENRLTLAIDGNHPNDNNETLGAGLEYVWNDLLALRMGYKGNHDSENFSFGGGLNLILSGLHFNFDYAYGDLGDLDTVQRFTAGIAF